MDAVFMEVVINSVKGLLVPAFALYQNCTLSRKGGTGGSGWVPSSG